MAFEKCRFGHRLKFGAAIVAIGAWQHHQIGKPRPGRDMPSQIGQLGNAGFTGPSNIRARQQFFHLRFKCFGFVMCAGNRLLQDHSACPGIVISGLTPIDAKAEHIQMRVMRGCHSHGLCHGLFDKSFIGYHGKQAVIRHRGFLMSGFYSYAKRVG